MKKAMVLLIAVGMLMTTIAQAQDYEWRWQNPVTTTNSFFDITAIDANTAVAVGNSGAILKTINGGENWDIQYQGLIGIAGIRNALYSVVFVNDDYGWTVGEEGTILRTKNGGETWSYQYTDQNTPALYGLFFADTLDGWTTGINSGDTLSQVLHTTDGGHNWVTSFTASGQLLGVYFLNTDIGWVVGMDRSHTTGVVYKTTDGGENWESTFIGPSASETMFYSVYFKDSNTGWVAGRYYSSSYNGVIYQTTDGGDTWDLIYESSGHPFYKIGFSDETNGWIAGDAYLLKTSDGGDSWQSISGYTGLKAVFIDENSGWQAGYYGEISKTSDGGQNWISCAQRACGSGVGLRGVDFADELEGWAVGYDLTTKIGAVIHTTDGGATWVEEDLGEITDTLLFDVHFNGRENGWILAFNGTMLHTSDGGESWSVKYDYPNALFRSSYFVDDLTGWVVDDNSGIHMTTDGGESWNVVDVSEVGVSGQWPISFVDESYGWVAGMLGIMRTTDGGLNWEAITVPPIMDVISDIAFISRSVGYVVSNYGDVYKTTDGGNSWIACATPPTSPLNLHIDLHFIDENTGWIGCARGNICYTTDGGNSWERIAASPSTYFRCFAAPTDSTVWAVGTEGAIMKYGNDSSTGIVLTDTDPIPRNYALMQNYPNPFNATTSISFSLAKAGDVKLSVFDILGRQVKALYDGTLAVGSYTLTWDGKNESGTTVASGIYLYRLETADDLISRQMTLLK